MTTDAHWGSETMEEVLALGMGETWTENGRGLVWEWEGFGLQLIDSKCNK